jgi:hypothetical protein
MSSSRCSARNISCLYSLDRSCHFFSDQLLQHHGRSPDDLIHILVSSNHRTTGKRLFDEANHTAILAVDLTRSPRVQLATQNAHEKIHGSRPQTSSISASNESQIKALSCLGAKRHSSSYWVIDLEFLYALCRCSLAGSCCTRSSSIWLSHVHALARGGRC